MLLQQSACSLFRLHKQQPVLNYIVIALISGVIPESLSTTKHCSIDRMPLEHRNPAITCLTYEIIHVLRLTLEMDGLSVGLWFIICERLHFATTRLLVTVFMIVCTRAYVHSQPIHRYRVVMVTMMTKMPES